MDKMEKELVFEMLVKLRLVRDLMIESEGVAGYHVGDTIMPWGEWEDVSVASIDSLIKRIEIAGDF